jgi:hypothetical protein
VATVWVVNRKAIEVVDRALQLSGGSGCLSRSRLSRLYRDGRAGPFMQPCSPNEAVHDLGKVTLGPDPRIEETRRRRTTVLKGWPFGFAAPPRRAPRCLVARPSGSSSAPSPSPPG